MGNGLPIFNQQSTPKGLPVFNQESETKESPTTVSSTPTTEGEKSTEKGAGYIDSVLNSHKDLDWVQRLYQIVNRILR